MPDDLQAKADSLEEETTITVVVPLLAQPGWRKLGCAARMWAIVLASNLVGTGLFALFASLTPAVPDALQIAMLEVSRTAVLHPPLESAWVRW